MRTHLTGEGLSVKVNRTRNHLLFVRLDLDLLPVIFALQSNVDVDWGRKEVCRHNAKGKVRFARQKVVSSEKL